MNLKFFELYIIRPFYMLHELTHLAVAKIFKMNIDSVTLFERKNGKCYGKVVINFPKNINSIFLLKFAVVAIAPAIWTIIILISIYKIGISNIGLNSKFLLNYTLLSFIVLGLRPSKSDIIQFIGCLYSAITKTAIDEDGNPIKIS